MALIQEIATPLFQQIISWANLLLVILIIYKLIRVIMSIAGGDFKIPGLGGSKKKDRKNKKPEEPDDPDEVEEEQDKIKEKLKKNGLNPDKKVKVIVRVIDKDGNPVMGANTVVWPYHNKGLKKLKYKLGETAPNGYTWKPEPLSSGRWVLRVTKKLWQLDRDESLGFFRRMYSKLKKFLKAASKYSKKYKNSIVFYASPDFIAEGRDYMIVPITLNFTLETGFTPRIISISETRGHDGRQRLRLEGKVN